MSFNEDRKLTREAANKLNTFKKRSQKDETAGQYLKALKNLATEVGQKDSGGWYEVQVVRRFIRGVKYPEIKEKLRVMKNIPSLRDLEYMCRHTPSVFDRLSGWSIDHIYGKIFFSLDEKSLKDCLKVCQDWRTIIERIKPSEPVDGLMIYTKEMREMTITKEELRKKYEEEHEVQEKCEERALEMRQCYLQMYQKIKGSLSSRVENDDHVAAVDWMLALMGEAFLYESILTEDQRQMMSLEQRNFLETSFQRRR